MTVLLLLNALLYRTITSIIMFASIMNVDESNNIRIVYSQKGKGKLDPGPTQATARMVKKQYNVGLH